jgi:hypothetical protein
MRVNNLNDTVSTQVSPSSDDDVDVRLSKKYYRRCLLLAVGIVAAAYAAFLAIGVPAYQLHERSVNGSGIVMFFCLIAAGAAFVALVITLHQAEDYRGDFIEPTT